MTARLQHRGSPRGGLVLRVQPNDGRYVETFDVDAVELRRFAWAVLADLDPDEAEAAAAETGRALADLLDEVARPETRRGVGNFTRRFPLVACSDEHHILARLLRLPFGQGDAEAIAYETAGSRTLIHHLNELCHRGYVRRSPGKPPIFEITAAGREALAHVEARACTDTEAAA